MVMQENNRGLLEALNEAKVSILPSVNRSLGMRVVLQEQKDVADVVQKMQEINVSLLKSNADLLNTAVQDRLDGKTADEVQEKLWLLEKYARGRKNINVVPISGNKHHILIDDLTLDKLRQFKEDGYRPSCVIESSPGNFQAILTMPKLGDNPEIDREVANRLTKRLNECYGDPKLSGAVHAHRLPPFENCKLKHRREDGSYPPTHLIEAEGGLCQKALEELQGLLREVQNQKKVTASIQKVELLAGSEGANDPDGAYWKHYEDVARHFGGAMDYSH